MKDNLRDAAQAALETLEDVFGKDKIDVSAINNLRAALAEPVVKESLTTQPNNTPRTDAEFSDDYYTSGFVRTEFAQQLERQLAAAQAEIAALRNFVDKNMTFYDVDADSLVDAPNIPVLAQVSNRIWYHATDDTKSCPFSAVIDAAMKECGK